MTIITNPSPRSPVAEPRSTERRWHLLTLAALAVAATASVLAAVALARDITPAVEPASVEAELQQPVAEGVPLAASTDAKSYRGVHVLDACGRPIVESRPACD